ncbi:DUF1847 domain-containing protein [Peptococcaceae bacterium]|nr:DUF1847 domain-containing protein [Peptococcaceae bacterium]MCL0063256.1 DUF1847 domain-containing protein [Peptococcaceae bacterium]MCL0071880.1 DUF1847 domain-containing protein [Peptococcaceae bacterium]
MKCAECKQKPVNRCDKEGFDCTGGKLDLSAYELEENKGPHRISGHLQFEYGNELSRLEELIEFCKQMKYQKLGLAFCVSVAEEAKIISRILSNQGFDVRSVCCKVGGLDKKDFDIPYMKMSKIEVLCNPIAQAEILNKTNVDLNIELGLCVGHDLLFHKYAKAPTTVLAVKDRILAHNPLGAIYSSFWRKKFKV